MRTYSICSWILILFLFFRQYLWWAVSWPVSIRKQRWSLSSVNSVLMPSGVFVLVNSVWVFFVVPQSFVHSDIYPVGKFKTEISLPFTFGERIYILTQILVMLSIHIGAFKGIKGLLLLFFFFFYILKEIKRLDIFICLAFSFIGLYLALIDIYTVPSLAFSLVLLYCCYLLKDIKTYTGISAFKNSYQGKVSGSYFLLYKKHKILFSLL